MPDFDLKWPWSDLKQGGIKTGPARLEQQGLKIPLIVLGRPLKFGLSFTSPGF